jgi:hypothetical protein
MIHLGAYLSKLSLIVIGDIINYFDSILINNAPRIVCSNYGPLARSVYCVKLFIHSG